jgi:hypothetical protein
VSNTDFAFLVKASPTGTAPQGPVRITPPAKNLEDPHHSNKLAGYLVRIPPRMQSYFGGRTMFCGASGKDGGGRQSHSNGPAVYAFSPGNWPPDNTIDLLHFSLLSPDSDYTPTDRWWGAGCLDDGASGAVVIIGRKGSDQVQQPYPPDFDLAGNLGFYLDKYLQRWAYYGPPIPGVHVASSKGYHGDPYRAEIRFYDPSISPFPSRPYEIWHPAELYGHPLAEISGATSPDGRRLFVSEFHADGTRPVIHVWDVVPQPVALPDPVPVADLSAEINRLKAQIERIKTALADLLESLE